MFEHSPWIAEAASTRRPFSTIEELCAAFRSIVENSDAGKKVALISAHPDLAGRAALAGKLSTSSASEQASVGLTQLSPAEIEAFQNQNRIYREKFGFPFVICARLNQKETILQSFESRLKHSREVEIQTALEEIYKIAYLRLQDIVKT